MQTNLFSSEVNNLKSRFQNDLGEWIDVFPESTLLKLQMILKQVRDDSINAQIYPAREDVLRIYRDCSIDKVRVVILGQDPYFNGNANGYAFSCKQSISPSLKQIVHSIDSTCEKANIHKDISLRYMVEQGVFLLNTILTVRANAPLSHERLGWQQFTKETIELINKQDRHIVWLLWGSKAKEYKKYITNLEHKVLIAEHPVAASHNGRMWNCNHFVETNKFFKDLKQEEIKWR